MTIKEGEPSKLVELKGQVFEREPNAIGVAPGIAALFPVAPKTLIVVTAPDDDAVVDDRGGSRGSYARSRRLFPAPLSLREWGDYHARREGDLASRVRVLGPYVMFAYSVFFGWVICICTGLLLTTVCCARRSNFRPLLALPFAWLAGYFILLWDPLGVLYW